MDTDTGPLAENSDVFVLLHRFIGDQWITISYLRAGADVPILPRTQKDNIIIMRHLESGRMSVNTGDKLNDEDVLHRYGPWGNHLIPAETMHKVVVFKDQPAFLTTRVMGASGEDLIERYFPTV